MIGRARDKLQGSIFGRIKVLKYAVMRNKNSVWWCKCFCGKVKTIYGCHLKSGRVISCGCVRNAKFIERSTTHGMSQTATHSIWKTMTQRCRDKKSTGYKYYGGRGIKVCKRWLKFENFLEDMGRRPKGMSIDRINNNGNYTKSNCRWATYSEQANNKSNNRIIEHNHRRMTVTQWERECGFLPGVITSRLNRGWQPERAITTQALRRSWKISNK